MAYPHKKHVILSQNMDHLKTKINETKEKQKPFTEIIYNRGKFVQYLVEGAQKILGLIAQFINATEEMRIVGFAFRMFSVIPNAITTLTDKNSSIIKKIFASAILLTTTGLGITAFVLGGVVAAGIGLAFASLATLIAGMSLISSLINKYQTSKAYKEKKEFIDLLNKRDDSLDNDAYRERLEIRALELEHLLEQSSGLSPEKEELEFINKIRNKRKYESPQVDNSFLQLLNTVRRKIGLSELPPAESPVAKLSKLYEERKAYVVYLAGTIKRIDQKNEKESDPDLIDRISAIQHHIDEIEKDIERITEPLHQLELNNSLADETIAKSYTNLALGGIGVLLSTISLMVLLGTIVAPPMMVLYEFGIGLAVFGLVKWGVDLYFNREDEKIKEERAKENEEIILEEALDHYDKKRSCSYSTTLLHIINSKPTAEPIELQNINDLIEMKEIISTPPLSPEQPQEELKEFQI